jgi:hypothetical protein
VLSDRQALLNCLPAIWSSNGAEGRDRSTIWNRISPEVLDRALLVEVLSRSENDPFHSVLSEAWKGDLAVARARLRSTTTTARPNKEKHSCYLYRAPRSFMDVYASLSLELQVQCADLLTQHMLEKTDWALNPCFQSVHPEVYHVPEVAHAAISRGWGTSSYDGFSEAAASAPWIHDPHFLLEIARRHSVRVFWKCCQLGRLRRNKDLMLSVLKVNPAVWNCFVDTGSDNDDADADAGHDLAYDFDVLCHALGRSQDDAVLARLPRLDSASRRSVTARRLPTNRLVHFARELRSRLVLSASIQVVMGGISCRTSPLSLLNQDAYTQRAFRCRLTELLGAPPPSTEGGGGGGGGDGDTDGDGSLAILRSASNALSRYGF